MSRGTPLVSEGFTLWFRTNKRFAWREVATAPTEAELTGRLNTLGSGECVCLPQGEHPDERAARKKKLFR